MKTNRGITRAVQATGAILLFSISCVPHETTDPKEGTGDKSQWGFTFTAERTSLTIKQSAADTVPLTMTRSGGYNGDIIPQSFPMGGYTVDFTAPVRNGLVTTQSVIFTIGGTTGPIEFKTIIAAVPQTEALQPKNIEFTLNIIRKDGTFITAPATMSVSRGGSTSVGVGVIRTNFTDPVPMSLATTTTGLTASFSPNPITGTTSTMTLSADATVPEGTYNIGVRSFAGLSNQGTAPVTLTVTPPAAPGSIAVSFSVGTLIVPRNNTVPIGLNIVRTNYTGAVSVTVAGIPGGVTFTANPSNTNSVSISFSATAGATPGTYPLVVTASGAGIPDATANLSLQIPQ
ncbi:MAG TPA: hypothetical protein VM099_07890 [Gemmatimonadaceae bacterium]|nr:hypothetical protein [Gemmatimonadaceae bacterium]